MQDADSRKAPRLKTIKSGQVIIGSPDAPIDCTIRNISAVGALIRLDREAVLPPSVELVIVSHDIQVRANLVWQNGADAGLEFEGDLPD